MSLYGYKPKTKKAPWTQAFKEQIFGNKPGEIGGVSFKKAKQSQKLFEKFLTKKRIRSVSKSKAKSDRVYNALARDFIAGKKCVVCKFEPATENHHFYGRLGRLKFWIPGFRAVCSLCHSNIHNHIGWAIENGHIAPKGCWNNYDKAVEHEQQLRAGALKGALIAYKEHHDAGIKGLDTY